MRRSLTACLVLVLLASACGDRLAAGTAGVSPSASSLPVASATVASGTIVAATVRPSGAPTPTPVVTPIPTPSPTVTPAAPGALTLAQLKYRLFDRFGRLWYCDPDFYPVARADETSLAEQRFPEIQKDAEAFMAILAHLGYVPSATYSQDQKLAIYRDWKMLGALRLDPAGGSYHFAARFTPDGRTGSLVDGTIDPAGRIVVASQRASGPPPCPICLARGTLIATPAGSLAIESLREGMAVWTTDPQGVRAAAVILAVGSMTAPADHRVVHLVLSDGRELRASPGHPLADGRPLGAVVPGETVDGATVVIAELVPYGLGKTFDLLPSGPTATYWADGVPLGSTIGR